MTARGNKVMPLCRSFYRNDTVRVARKLLGKTLVKNYYGSESLVGIITEVEAYRHKDDPASHAYRGVTNRNKAMFNTVGHAYVYFTYGMYHCFNVVAKSAVEEAGAVLLRGVLPVTGIKTMKENRKTDHASNLTNGPGKLTQAFDITKEHYGIDLTKSYSRLCICEQDDVVCDFFGMKPAKLPVVTGRRKGIKKAVEYKWNFSIESDLVKHVLKKM